MHIFTAIEHLFLAAFHSIPIVYTVCWNKSNKAL